MNCTVCMKPIDRDRGYYLVRGEPLCLECYQRPEKTDEIANETIPPPFEWRESENLLEAFRTYQKRNRPSACRRL
jgi:hypothetical protein